MLETGQEFNCKDGARLRYQEDLKQQIHLIELRQELSSTGRQVSIHVHYQGLIASPDRSITVQQYCKGEVTLQCKK